MTWFKVDDRLHSHIKTRRAGPAMALWVIAGSYCSDNLTDGFVASDVPELLLAGGRDMADRLVAAGLWEECEGGWRFHDFHDHNPSAEAERDRRAEIAKKRADAGKRGAESRWQNGKPDGKRIAKPKQTPWQNDGPVPVPVPVPVPESVTPIPSPETETSRSPTPSSPDAEPPATLPLRAGAGLEVLAAHSGGRFPAVEPRDVGKGHAVALIATLKRYRLRDEWVRLARWLAAGGLAWKTELGVGWVASAAFSDAMAQSRAWDGVSPVPSRAPPAVALRGRVAPVSREALQARGDGDVDLFARRTA